MKMQSLIQLNKINHQVTLHQTDFIKIFRKNDTFQTTNTIRAIGY